MHGHAHVYITMAIDNYRIKIGPSTVTNRPVCLKVLFSVFQL